MDLGGTFGDCRVFNRQAQYSPALGIRLRGGLNSIICGTKPTGEHPMDWVRAGFVVEIHPLNCENSMSRPKPVRWADALKKLFSPVRRMRRRARLAPSKNWGDRIVPAGVTFTASTTNVDSLAFDSGTNSGTLRGCINAANFSSQTDVTIDLVSGANYKLTLANTAGVGQQENVDATGDLDVSSRSRESSAASRPITSSVSARVRPSARRFWIASSRFSAAAWAMWRFSSRTSRSAAAEQWITGKPWSHTPTIVGAAASWFRGRPMCRSRTVC